jgi:hypothetical protein
MLQQQLLFALLRSTNAFPINILAFCNLARGILIAYREPLILLDFFAANMAI